MDLNFFLHLGTNKQSVEDYKIEFECNGDETKDVIEKFYNSKPYWKTMMNF